MLRCRYFAPQLFDAKRALDQHLGFAGVTRRSRRRTSGGVVTDHDRLGQTGAVNPANAECYDV